MDNDKPDFNMAILYLERLNKRLDERDISSLNADLIAWYRCLKTIYRNIHFKIVENKDETLNAELLEMFENAKNLLSNMNNKMLANVSISKAEETLDLLDGKLNDLMYKYHLIFPKKMFETYLQEIEGDY